MKFHANARRFNKQLARNGFPWGEFVPMRRQEIIYNCWTNHNWRQNLKVHKVIFHAKRILSWTQATKTPQWLPTQKQKPISYFQPESNRWKQMNWTYQDPRLFRSHNEEGVPSWNTKWRYNWNSHTRMFGFVGPATLQLSRVKRFAWGSERPLI